MNKLVLTLDLDWCEDKALDYVLKKLILNRIPATFFVTHYTNLLKEIRKYNFFELGIHPNFNHGSTHGNNDKEIIDYCLEIVPEAISSRSHGLNISSNRLIHLMEKGIKIDCSIFMPNISILERFYFQINKNKILRQPYNWEDDYEFYQNNPKYKFDNIENFNDKILNFHPIHIYLNSNSEQQYSLYKLNKEVEKNKGIGVETMLDGLINKYLTNEVNIISLKEYTGLL